MQECPRDQRGPFQLLDFFSRQGSKSICECVEGVVIALNPGDQDVLELSRVVQLLAKIAQQRKS
jgi:hypothetical protein